MRSGLYDDIIEPTGLYDDIAAPDKRRGPSIVGAVQLDKKDRPKPRLRFNQPAPAAVPPATTKYDTPQTRAAIASYMASKQPTTPNPSPAMPGAARPPVKPPVTGKGLWTAAMRDYAPLQPGAGLPKPPPKTPGNPFDIGEIVKERQRDAQRLQDQTRAGAAAETAARRRLALTDAAPSYAAVGMGDPYADDAEFFASDMGRRALPGTKAYSLEDAVSYTAKGANKALRGTVASIGQAVDSGTANIAGTLRAAGASEEGVRQYLEAIGNLAPALVGGVAGGLSEAAMPQAIARLMDAGMNLEQIAEAISVVSDPKASPEEKAMAVASSAVTLAIGTTGGRALMGAPFTAAKTAARQGRERFARTLDEFGSGAPIPEGMQRQYPRNSTFEPPVYTEFFADRSPQRMRETFAQRAANNRVGPGDLDITVGRNASPFLEPGTLAPSDAPRVFTAEAYRAAKEGLKQKTARASSGIDPGVLSDLYVIGGYHVENGIREFADWAGRVMDDVGAWAQPYLDRVWRDVQPGGAGAPIRKAAQAVDGAPVVADVFHGTPDMRFAEEYVPGRPFPDMPGRTPNDATFLGKIGEGFAVDDRGVFFSDNPRVANTYRDNKMPWDYQNAIPATLRRTVTLGDPLVLDAKGQSWKAVRDAVDVARGKGKDGVVVKNVRDAYSTVDNPRVYNEPATNVVALDKKQITRGGAARDVLFTDAQYTKAMQRMRDGGDAAAARWMEQNAQRIAELKANRKRGRNMPRNAGAVDLIGALETAELAARTGAEIAASAIKAGRALIDSGVTAYDEWADAMRRTIGPNADAIASVWREITSDPGAKIAETVVNAQAKAARTDTPQKIDARKRMHAETVAVQRVRAGVKDFGEFSRAMEDDLGPEIRPMLEDLYKQAQDAPKKTPLQPGVQKAYAKYGRGLYDAGNTTYSAWARAMLKTHGARVQKGLPFIWKDIQKALKKEADAVLDGAEPKAPMTPKDTADALETVRRAYVADELRRGKRVPDKMLEEYPDLKTGHELIQAEKIKDYETFSRRMEEEMGAGIRAQMAETWRDLTGHGGGIDATLMIKVDGPKAGGTVPANPKGAKVETALEALDRLAEEFPNPFQDAETYIRFMKALRGNVDGRVPAVPEQLIRYASDPDFVARDVASISARQRALAEEGFRAAEAARRAYASGALDEVDSALYLLWGSLSKRMSPYPHETAFLKTAAEGMDLWIQLAKHGEFTPDELKGFREWTSTVLKGSPGAGGTSNANGFGEYFLLRYTEKLTHGPYKGLTVGEAWHRLMADDLTAAEARRRLLHFPKVGIDNKVLDLLGLITGRTDGLPMDRVRFNDGWDLAPIVATNGVVRAGTPYGLNIGKLGIGAQGVALYEAITRAIQDNVMRAYQMRGDTTFLGVGRWHWETWVARSGQEVSHVTQNAIPHRKGLLTQLDASVAEGRYDELSFGIRTVTEADGVVRYKVELQNGKTVTMDQDGYRSFLDELKEQRDKRQPRLSAKDRAIPYGFKNKDFETHPWLESPEINRDAYDRIAARHAISDRPNPKAADGTGGRPDGPGSAAAEAEAPQALTPAQWQERNRARIAALEKKVRIGAARAGSGIDPQLLANAAELAVRKGVDVLANAVKLGLHYVDQGVASYGEFRMKMAEVLSPAEFRKVREIWEEVQARHRAKSSDPGEYGDQRDAVGLFRTRPESDRPELGKGEIELDSADAFAKLDPNDPRLDAMDADYDEDLFRALYLTAAAKAPDEVPPYVEAEASDLIKILNRGYVEENWEEIGEFLEQWNNKIGRSSDGYDRWFQREDGRWYKDSRSQTRMIHISEWPEWARRKLVDDASADYELSDRVVYVQSGLSDQTDIGTGSVPPGAVRPLELIEDNLARGKGDAVVPKAFAMRWFRMLRDQFEYNQARNGTPTPGQEERAIDSAFKNEAQRRSADTSPMSETPNVTDPTGVAAANRSTAELMARMGLDEATAPPAETVRDWIDAAENIAEDVDDIVADVIENPRVLSDVETTALMMRLDVLKREYNALYAKARGAEGAELETIMRRMRQIGEEVARVTQATRTSGAEWGRAGVARQYALNENFDPVNIMTRAREANGDRPLTPEQQGRFDELTRRLLAAENNLSKAEKEAADLRVELGKKQSMEELEKAQSRMLARDERKRAARKAYLVRDTKDAFSEVLKLLGSTANVGLPADVLAKVAPIIKRIALNVAELTGMAYADVKAKVIEDWKANTGQDLDPEDYDKALSGDYPKPPRPAATPTEAELRRKALINEARNIRKAIQDETKAVQNSANQERAQAAKRAKRAEAEQRKAEAAAERAKARAEALERKAAAAAEAKAEKRAQYLQEQAEAAKRRAAEEVAAAKAWAEAKAKEEATRPQRELEKAQKAEETRLKAEIKAIEKRIAGEPNAAPNARGDIPDTPEIAALKAKKADLQQRARELADEQKLERKLESARTKAQRERARSLTMQEKSLVKQIAELEDQIRRGDFEATKPTPKERQTNEAIEALRGRREELRRQIRGEIRRLELEQKRSTVDEVLVNLWRAGLLTGPGTQARNIAGNMASIVADNVARYPAALADLLMSAVTKRRTITAGNVRAGTAGLKSAATKGMKDAAETLRRGATPEEIAKYEFPGELQTYLAGRRIGWLDAYVNGVYRLQAAGDKPFREYEFKRSIVEQAQLEAKNARLKGQSAEDRIRALIANPTEQMLIRAIARSEEAVFGNSNRLTEAIGKFQSTLRADGEGAANTGGRILAAGIDTVLPFKQIPSNIAGRIAESNAIGGTLKIGMVLADAFRGKVAADDAQRQIAMAFGRGVTGTALILAGYELAKRGKLQPAYNPSQGVRDRNEAAGNEPGALEVGGRRWKVDSSPAGNLMILGATIYNATQEGKRGKALGVAALESASNQLLEMPVLQGAKDILQTGENPVGRGQRWAASQVGSLIPAIVNDAAKAGDPVVRAARTTEEAVTMRTPEFPIPGDGRTSLPIKYDALGNPVRQKPWWDALNAGEKTSSPVAQELARLRVNLSKAKRESDPENPAYDKDERAYQEKVRKTGRAVSAELFKEMAKPGYEAKTDAEKKEALQKAIKKAKREISESYKEKAPKLSPF